MVRPHVAWLSFALVAAVPSAAVIAVATRAAAAEAARVREDARTAREAAARALERDVDAALLGAKDAVRALPDDESGRIERELAAARPRFADVVIVDASGRLVTPASPGADAEPTATCVGARAALLGPGRAEARAKILAECPDLRAGSGRYLWPLLALEDPRAAGELAPWLARHHGRLAANEIAVLRARVTSLPETKERAAALAELDRAPSVYSTLATLLGEPADNDVVDGRVRVHRGRYVGVLATLPSGRRAGYVIHEESLFRGAELGAGLALARGSVGDASDVRVAPRLPLHVTSRGIPGGRSAEGTARAILGAAIASVVGSVGLAALLFARARRAQRLAELRTDFVAAVSHELRTPAASVRMLAELLERGDVPDDERAEIERTLAGESRRLGATLDRMLRFGALARGKLAVERTQQPLSPIVDAAVARFRASHPSKEVLVERDDSLEGDVDAALVGLALDNLLSNAAKYAPEGGPYRIGVRRAGKDVVLAVSDSGPGLDAAAQRRVFLPFERADDRLSRATEGTGVGLALVRGIARAHGGDATVVSAPGRGATFEIRLPRGAAPNHEERA